MRRRPSASGGVVCLRVAMVLCASLPALADDEPSAVIRVGESVTGEIAAAPGKRGSAFFAFEAAAAGPVTITARSLLFDSYLVVWREGADGRLEKVAEDDDSGGWPHSQVVIEAEGSTRYRIEARSAEVPYCGREFEIRIATGRPPPPADDPFGAAREFLGALERAAATTKSPECQVRALLMRGWLLQQEGDPARALQVTDEAFVIVRADLGPDHLLTASSLDQKATSLQMMGSYKDARPLFEEALRMKEAILGPHDTDVGTSLTNLGAVLSLLGLYSDALPLVERSIAIQTESFGPTHPSVLRGQTDLAWYLNVMGSYREARKTIEDVVSLRLKVQGPDHPEVAASLEALGVLLGSTGSNEESLAALERARSIYERALGLRHPQTLRALHNIASTLRQMGRYSEARPLAETTVRLAEEVSGTDHPDLAYSLDNLGMTLQLLGAYDEAKTLFERSLAISLKRLGPDHDRVATAINNLAVLLHAMRRLEEAAKLYEQALETQARTFGSGHKKSVITLGNLASVRSGLGEDLKARELYERALAIAETADLRDSPSTALNLLKYGQLLQKMALTDEGLRAITRGLEIRRKALGEDHPETGQAWGTLARIRHQTGDPGALDAALSAERIGREHLALTARTLAESRALQYASVRASGLDLALTLAAETRTSDSATRVWDAVVRSRAVVLDEMASRRRALRAEADPATAPAAQTLRSASSRLANLMVRGPGQDPPDRYRGLLDDARREKESAEQALAEKSAAFRREQASGRLRLSDVIAALPEQSALVAFSIYTRDQKATPQRSYLAFAARQGASAPAVIDLGDAETIDTLVSRWRDEAGGGALRGEAAYRKAGAHLRRKIWDPIASHLGDATRVFLVPDGALSLVSLAALPTDRGAYLIEDGPTLHYLSSERDLLAPATPPASGGLLALGGAAFDAAATSSARATFRGEHSNCESFAKQRFERLPATAREVEEISGLWRDKGPAPALLTGDAATEAAFKAQAPGHRVLHLATHGFFLDGRCPSALDASRGVGVLVKASDPPPSDAPPPATGENPLLLSGLVLAGANQRGQATAGQEDGILTAEEVASLDLSGVEWAVLSACDTGVGEVKAGEGVFGLRRAFQVAGAATVIMSLWSVEDESARRWMTALYEGRLKKGLGTAEAVRQAGLSLLQQRRSAKQSTHPFFWAGFVAAGEWR